MARRTQTADPIVEKLDAILTVVQNLLIFEGAKAGMKRDELRRIVAVDNNRLSKVMRHVKRTKPTRDD
jgi:hypothetical protein